MVLAAQPTVLVVEDDPNDCFLLERAFNKAEINAALKWTKDGKEAQAYLGGQSPYQDRDQNPLPVLILADLKMPRMNGFELLDWVKQQPYLKRIPYVVLTSSSQHPDINKAYDLGASSYLVKPSGFEDLCHLSRNLKTYWLSLNRNPVAPTS